MSLVVLVGDCTTTTALALAAGWRADAELLVIECDPRGGSMAAWLGLPVAPSLSTLVATARSVDWPMVGESSRLAPCGLRVVPAPVGIAEASGAVDEAAHGLFPLLASSDEPIVIADAGPVSPSRVHPALGCADVIALVHRQSRSTARAAAVRVERLAEQYEIVSTLAATALIVIGDGPFEPAQIAAFVGGDGADTGLVRLPEDPLAAAVLAGRTGISARRLARLPLMRGAATAADHVERVLVRNRCSRREVGR